MTIFYETQFFSSLFPVSILELSFDVPVMILESQELFLGTDGTCDRALMFDFVGLCSTILVLGE